LRWPVWSVIGWGSGGRAQRHRQGKIPKLKHFEFSRYATEICNAVADGKKFSKLNKSLDFVPQCGYMKSGYTFEDKIPALDRRI
jgi:hypothetical protein